MLFSYWIRKKEGLVNGNFSLGFHFVVSDYMKGLLIGIDCKELHKWLQILPKAITELWYAAFKEIPQKLGTARTKLILLPHTI